MTLNSIIDKLPEEKDLVRKLQPYNEEMLEALHSTEEKRYFSRRKYFLPTNLNYIYRPDYSI